MRGFSLLALLLARAAQGLALAAPLDTALFEEYCVACHNQKARTGGLALDSIKPGDIPQRPEIWEKVIHKLRLGSMPPQGMPQPERKRAAQDKEGPPLHEDPAR